jgi:ribosomal protein S18 acetylase RimI-like enzyme
MARRSITTVARKSRMALAETPPKVSHRGQWPGPVTVRRGWARAEARPWNDAQPEATIRLVRGGAPFLQAATEFLHQLGAPAVLSPPLPASARRMWRSAGYVTFMDLALMRRSLDRQPPSPDHLVVEGNDVPLEQLLAIDVAAFSPFWRFDALGLQEAIEATPRTTVLIIRDREGLPAGFAIVGFGSAVSYLQRVAVSPEWQGKGMGRSLVRVAARKARESGTKVMLLNTQFDNESAIALYESEDFVLLPEPLALLRNVP